MGFECVAGTFSPIARQLLDADGARLYHKHASLIARPMNAETDQNASSRRRFLRTSSAAVMGGALASSLQFPSVTLGAPNSKKLRIGLVGCGGRGTGAAAQALKADSNVELTAMGDLLAEPMEKSLASLQKQAADKIKVEPERKFVGFDAYQKVIDSGGDVVLLTTPPG